MIRKLPRHPRNQGEQKHQPRRGDGEWAGAGAAAKSKVGQGRGRERKVSKQRHPDGSDGARPKHRALAHREYGLLAPEEPAGDPAAAGPQGSGDIPKDSMGTGGTNGRETGTGERNGHHTLLTRGQTGDEEEEQGPPE